MAINMYVKSLVSNLNGDKQGKTVYYAWPKDNDRVELSDVLDYVVDATSLARGDAKNCIETFFEIVCKSLQHGSLVDLGDLGSFKVVVPSKYMDTPEDVTVAKALKTPKIQFTPKQAMLNAAKSVSVTIDHGYTPTAAEAAEGATGAGSDTSQQGGDEGGD